MKVVHIKPVYVWTERNGFYYITITLWGIALEGIKAIFVRLSSSSLITQYMVVFTSHIACCLFRSLFSHTCWMNSYHL